MRSLIAILIVPVLFAQDGKYQTKLGTETIEALGGLAYRRGDGKADLAAGTKLLVGLNRFMSLYGDYGYSRLISGETHYEIKRELRGSIMDFGGGGELHLSGSRLQPFILAGIGSVRISAKAAIGAFNATASEYRFSSSLGGGVRIFATRNIGFSAEMKTVTINDAGRFERYGLGIFFQQRPRDVQIDFVAPYREPAPDPIATVIIESNQPGSEVLVDAKPRGLAPVLLTLPSGTRYIVVRHAGFQDWTQNVETKPSDKVTVRAELKPIPEETFVITMKPTAPRN